MKIAEIKLDGINAQVTLAASLLEDLEGRVSSAEITLDGAVGEIELKVSQDEVISAINLSPESITINSKKML